ncbi:hypothetical protein O6H91_11G062000 [Diphasiastrum complanatum]|uniref:Uncharacterized protein n=2 Tax=Diphasiastrum complanatum TaxID=34168 RepID=A0ACC2CA08_DIPCM|nr:hypothetical protein O6H91_11G062000 [Diphasiastrum complanatum]
MSSSSSSSGGGGKALRGSNSDPDAAADATRSFEAISESYEELFAADEVGEKAPCYLPHIIIMSGGLDEEAQYHPHISAAEVCSADGEDAAAASRVGVKALPSNGSEKEDSNDEEVAAEFSTIRLSAESDEDVSEPFLEVPLSQSGSSGGTSGYVAGSGSSPASVSSVSGLEEIGDAIAENGCRDDHNLQAANWIPGKRHPDEDDASPSWRGHKKHFLILSNAGKPIYSRYGDENRLAGFSATIQAIMSFVQNSGDCIQSIRAGNHQIVFLVKGPIFLVSICATEEPIQALQRQLELLHGQLLLLLTKAVDKCFEKNSKFDMRPLLGGTDVVFSSLVHAFNWNFTTFLHAYTCLPLPYTARQAAGAALQDVADSGVLFALLMCGSKVISIVGPRKASLHPDDFLLLSNFVSSSDSFRRTETFSPICLPCYNPTAFLYAYVQYLEADTCLVLITTKSDGFFHLKECRARIENILRDSCVLHEISSSILRGGLHVEDLVRIGADSQAVNDRTGKTSEQDGRFCFSGPVTQAMQKVSITGGPAGLWHFIYKSTYLNQYVASEYAAPLHTLAKQKRLFKTYQRLHASMHNESASFHKMQYRRDENYVLLSWRTSDFELYAAFDPLAEKNTAISVCNQICQWLRDLESEIFLLEPTAFGWYSLLTLISQKE